ncbi:hypothetical protein [Streptomyces sp. MZ04]|uniref:hypothetical protein n=1 Tax=Streptomyces sp. MZ04 TaxID=2559236 RepID=UPI00107E6875|nr:hypothetical protein [Streptomyces sp. MZ04]TGB05592.1 hypothetical protein E2651_24795 [Streptomyces sp. MZ04]
MAVRPELVDGAYKLTQDLSDTAGRDIVEENRGRAQIRDPRAVVGQYEGQGKQAGSALVVSGMYGRFRDPAGAREDLMDGAAEGQGAEVAVPARDIELPGAEVTVRCQVLVTAQGTGAGGGTSNVPMCAWGDDNTGAAVGVVTMENATQEPGDVDLEAVARTVLTVRKEMREPIS